MFEEPAASESLKVLKSKVAEKELPHRLLLFSTTFRPPTFKPSDAADSSSSFARRESDSEIDPYCECAWTPFTAFSKEIIFSTVCLGMGNGRGLGNRARM